MAITLTGSGGLFTRLGKLGHALSTINTARGTTIEDEVIDAIETVDADSDPVIRAALAPLLPALASGQASLGSVNAVIRQAAISLLIRQVNADNPLPEQTELAALHELIRQVIAADSYVAANTIAATVTQTSLDGDGAVIVSVKDARGRNLENLIAEDLECRVTGGTAGSESIEIRGEERIADKLHWDWPAGSGLRRTVTVCNPAGSNNLLSNGGFEDFTGGAADSWTADVGTWGDDWLEEASTVFAGSKAVELVGDGATLAQISQDITARLAALQQYALCIWLRRDGSAADAGTLTIDLYDGSNVIADDAGTNNSFAVDLTALTESFVAYSGTFRTPTVLPDEVTLRIRLSAALTNGRSVFLDHAGLVRMTQLNPSVPGASPSVAIVSGASNFTTDDYTGGGDGSRVFKIATTNDNAGDWQRLFARLFAMAENGLILPTSGDSEISDTLIG